MATSKERMMYDCACNSSTRYLSKRELTAHQQDHELLACGHREGTFTSKQVAGMEDVEYCSRCGQAADVGAWAQKLANTFNVPVLGQMAGLGTVEPNNG